MQDSTSNVTEVEGGLLVEEKKLRWKIDNFNVILKTGDSLKKQAIDYEFKDSKGVDYKATVYMNYGKAKSNDNGEGNEDKFIPIELHVDLVKQDKSGKQFEAVCTAIAEDAKGKAIFKAAAHSDLTFLSKNGYFWTLLKDSNNKDLVECAALTITFTFKIFTLKQSSITNANCKYPEIWKHGICSKIAKLENNENTSDVKIVSAEGQEFFAYRWILSEFSDVFEAMFRSDMVEKETGVVKLDELSGKSLRLVLHFMYTGEIGNEWSSPDIVEELIHAADKYQIKHLTNFLDSNLATICTIENAGNLLALAEQTSMKKAAKDIFAFIKANVTDSQKFLELVKNTTAFNCRSESLKQCRYCVK